MSLTRDELRSKDKVGHSPQYGDSFMSRIYYPTRLTGHFGLGAITLITAINLTKRKYSNLYTKHKKLKEY